MISITVPTGPTTADHDLAALTDFIASSRRLLVLTGAGCSTESGIPDYRSPGGLWSNHKPIYYADFVRSVAGRQRYWARSLTGWRPFARAVPNAAHLALAQLEAAGRLHYLITQNVDGLHQEAGSVRVLELHGNNDFVVCLGCRREITRQSMQEQLLSLNPTWTATATALAPDGDAELTTNLFTGFRVPVCEACGGILKPAVVFFGESVPVATVEFAMARVAEADALLVVGSSLTVWSGFRFVRAAATQGAPVAILNIGPTRADALAALKVEARCGELLPRVLPRLGAGAPSVGSA
jgi:NAD-dependent SIR2 family protein deacetylase